MEAVLNRLRELNDEELREEFTRVNLKCGPITATTRATFERKLARVLAASENSNSELDSSSSIGSFGSGSVNSVADNVTPAAAVVPTCAPTSRNPGDSSSEELDFGYGVGLNPPEEEDVSVMSSNSSADVTNSQYRTETNQTQVSPTFYYGVCPPWDDVLARTGKCVLFLILSFNFLSNYICPLLVDF